ncbi:receptor-like protein kinase isoform X2 [Prosopis cineraria]|uniref:receptor-like protein kinase isoform X2 n=1 Tax=Prosopis cineraria TaxID=364024 RepID=UPI0024103499|nr:receptor-like protein kinase isoform X2 [Prosopis cineraria]
MIILQLLIICLSAPLHSASALSSDGLTLLSLAKHWISVLPSLKSNWNSSDSTPCSWIGIQCDHYGNVIFLNLTKSGIFGQLGPEIGQLTHLQNLVLETNGFSGTIPLELGNCSMLEYIDLSDNYFDGNMPETLQKLQNLRYLSFSSNMLTGQIPDYLFQVPRLEVVDLHKNSLSGSIPSNIGNMTKLLKLYLSRNQLSGTVPSSIVNCSKLEALFVNDNMLTGILPQSLNNLNNLIYLDVKNNSLGGIIPLGFGSWGKLFILDLSFNVFSGGIPSGLGNCSSLAEFAAVKSNLVGSIPSSLGLLQKLLILRLPDNRLSGNIPPEIGNCKSLKKLHLYSNQLVGTIPQELGGLSKLEDLELYSNHLTGEIPLTIWKIQSLEHILLHNNSLFGKLPSEMTELKHLKNISLFDNQFSGSIPQNLGINSSLVKLDLMNNKFTGNIPPNLCFGKQLHLLNLGLNQLQGSIPHDLGRCATLGRLVLNKNNLSGPFPEFEGNQNLGYLDISRNNINGTIPSSLGNCTNLTALIMSTNNITGFIPSKLGNLVNLQVLNLAHNSLEGPLPHQLSYCTKMETFDVGFNFLNGSFPSSMRSWTGLTKLILRENRFSRDIPTFLSEYDQLLELQLGGNMFGGKIPTSMGSLQNLLYELNLSANKLTGEIPLEIGKLQKLQSLDISLNNLTGSLHVLDKLSSLREVNISYNSFVGPVPEWKMQRLNLSSSSFLGNPGLCVRCSRLNLSSCINYNLLKPCDSESTNHKGSKRSILFMALGFVGFVICLSGILVIYDRHSSQRSKKEVPAYPDEQIYIRQLRPISNLKDNVADYKEQEASYSNDEGDFRIIDLMNATENLSDQYIIGEGGHGIVYKAELDIGVFAIKKVKFGQSNRRKVNMVREIEMTRKIRHQNVARCLGSWIGEEYGLTISKYMENGSLHDVLHENDPLPYLEWNVRYKIAIGIAKGLAYLHHNCDPPVLHRDIKPKNILLDSDMQPCITDFGISIALNQSSTTVHMRSTYHLEIACMVVPSCELDIYSYGVVLLELITRKKVLDSSFEVEETTLVGWFKSIWRTTRELEEIVDSSIARELSDLKVMVQVIKVILVALICIETDPGKRLKMRDVVEFFETSIDPGIFVRRYGEFHLGSSLATAVASLFFQEEAKIPASRHYSSILHEAMEATANPNNLNVIGRGTHGVVYKVSLGPDLVYAVKKLAFAGNKGKIQSIVREIKILMNIRHRNLVGLLDFLFRENCGMLLYSYMTNGNLHDVLHEKNPPSLLGWTVRYRIAAGIAHGLAYLHYDCHPAILHRAIKPKNILLDYDMEPHIADFGIAKLLDVSSSSRSSSSVPENTYTTANTRESDVYSFGVVLFELITRKKAVDPSFKEGIEIVSWVRSLWQEARGIYKIIDSSLVEEVSDPNVLKRVINVLLVALRCTEEDPDMRPTMRDVIYQFKM